MSGLNFEPVIHGPFDTFSTVSVPLNIFLDPQLGHLTNLMTLNKEKPAEKRAQKSVITLFNLIGDDPLPGDYP